ncbi:GNAT family N-acetyltransferase [Rhizobium sp. No.120]
MTTTPYFITERLQLREILASDACFIGELISDEEVRRFLGGPVPIVQREAAISDYLSATDGKLAWLVETRGTQHPLGLISISRHTDGEDYELSYQLHPDAWGLGYATEAAMRVIEFALNDLRLERLIAETQSANTASRRLLERLGMKELRLLHRFGAEQVVYTS